MAGVEVATRISELIATAPPGSDPKSEGDNHLRLIKGVLQDVFDDSGDTIKTTLPIESPDGAKLGNTEIDGDLSLIGGISSTAAAIWAGFRTAVSRFVLNDHADGTGVDFFEVLATGVAKLKSATAARLELTGTLSGIATYDTAGVQRSVIQNNITNNTMDLFIYNAAGALTEGGNIMSTANSPTSGAGYGRILSGLLVQWGVASTDVNGNSVVTFPVVFPNGLGALVGTTNTGAGIPANTAYVVSQCNISNAQCTLQGRGISTGTVGVHASGQIRWVAVGY